MLDQNFFKSHAAAMKRYASSINLPESNDAPEWLLRDCLNEFSSSASDLDKNGSCRITVGLAGEHFSSLVGGPYNGSNVWPLLSYCARFAYERAMRSGVYGELDGSLFRLFAFANPKVPGEYAFLYSLALPGIATGIMMENVKAVEQSLENTNQRGMEARAGIDKKIKELEGAFKRGEEQVNTYRELADRLISHYNFMGLSKAFKMQAESAFRRKRNAVIWMTMTAVASVGIFLGVGSINSYSLAYAAIQPGELIWKIVGDRAVLSAVTVVPVVFLLIYFFRVAYAQFKSAEAVQLQYEHRYSMCAFIEGYANTKSTLPDVNMEKFEALVFSGITPDPGNIPATFDGMDGLLKIAGALKGKGP